MRKDRVDLITLGVIADTHVPDRSRALHPKILPTFRSAGVEAILHAGDISTPKVLRQLAGIAPVHAVQGNRDWVRLRHLPMSRRMTINGVRIGMLHGHGGLWRYLKEKVRVAIWGYQLDFYVPYLLDAFPDVDVIIFGHSHMPAMLEIGGRLLFNPGAPCAAHPDIGPSIGLLHIEQGKAIGQHIFLEKS